MSKKAKTPELPEDARYHNARKPLKRYRDVVWSLELSVQQLKNQFHVEYGSSVEDFL